MILPYERNKLIHKHICQITDWLIMTTRPTLPNFLRQKTYFIISSKAMAKINTRVVTAIIYIVDNTSVLTSEVTWPPSPSPTTANTCLSAASIPCRMPMPLVPVGWERYVHRHVVSADAERGQNGFVCREPMFKSHQNISKVATSVSVQFSSCVCSILWSLWCCSNRKGVLWRKQKCK